MRTFGYTMGLLASVVIASGCGGNETRTFVDGGLAHDQCLAAMDMEIVLASRVDAGAGVDSGAPNPKIEAYWCSRDPTCLGLFLNEQNDAGLLCVHDCLQGTTTGMLTLGCLDCFANEARDCAADFCLNDCLGDVAACQACFAVHCEDRLNICIGY